MSYQRFRQKVFLPLLVAPTILGAGALLAQDSAVDTRIIEDAKSVAQQAFNQARDSQLRINELSDQADELIEQYRALAKIVDGLEVYNAQMRRTIAEQEREIAQYDQSITEAAELQRQIPPLMERMLVALEQFVELDLPFQLDTRRQRLATIRASFDDSGVNVAEKFRAVLTGYQAEGNYGRDIANYTDVLEIDGVPRDVDVLRVGRVALLYQTRDQTATGMWDQKARQWVALGDEYRRPVREALRMAQQLTSIDIIEIPIAAPESAQ